MGVKLHSALLLAVLAAIAALSARAVAESEDGKLRVIDVGWGSPQSRAEAEPGDSAVTLYVVLQNTASFSLGGITAYLHLEPPFTNATGGNLGVASLAAIPPGGSGVLFYILDISDGDVGIYELGLEVEYSTPYGREVEELVVSVPLLGRSMLEVRYEYLLAGGRVSEVAVGILNNGTAEALRVSVSLELSPPLVVLGRSSWYFQEILPGEEKEFVAKIYAPSRATGSALTGMLTVSYTNAFGSPVVLRCPMGFVVRGEVDVEILGLVAIPRPVYAGEELTISASLVNRGTSAAEHVMLYLNTAHPFVSTPDSTRYVGELDPGTPIPFNLACAVDPGAEEGIYDLEVVLEYDDEYGNTYQKKAVVEVEVLEGARSPEPGEAVPWYQREYLGLPAAYWIAGLLVVLLVAVSIFFKRERHAPE